MSINNISEKLIKNIDKIFKNNNSLKIFNNHYLQNTNYSNKINSYLQNLFNILSHGKRESNNYFQNNNSIGYKLLDEYSKTSLISNNDMIQINNLLRSKFINHSIEEILKNIKQKLIFNINSIKITIYYNNYNKVNEIDYIIYNILTIYFALQNLYNTNNKKLDLTIFYCDIKKMYTSESFIGYKNMNSGLAYSNNIILFRKEELLKVFIHELMHFIGIDNNYHIQNNSKKLTNIFKFKSENNFNEAYTEFVALFIHTFYISFTMSENNFILTLKLFKILFYYEINFSLIQMVKFLNLYKLDFIDFFYKNQYSETTNTFSYIYLKFLFLLDYQYFLNIILNNNNISKFNENNIVNYIQYLKNNNMLNNINKIVNHFKKYIYFYCNKNNNFFCKNNRLSLIELDTNII